MDIYMHDYTGIGWGRNKLRAFYIIPCLSKDVLRSYDWGDPGLGVTGVTGEEAPHSRYVYYTLGQMETQGGIRLKNSMKTKNMFRFKTSSEKDFSASISPLGEYHGSPGIGQQRVICDNPQLQWFWDLTILDAQEPDVDEFKMDLLITETKFIRFWLPNRFMRNAAEADL